MRPDREFMPTATQAKAMREVDGDVVLAAGPGSGKTRVLVGRIERLLEEGVPPERVAAITFTRKAAAEMKGRLRAELMHRWRRTWDENPDRARHLRSLAWSVERMFMGTIHSFCSSILRKYPYRAGLDPEFAVVDPVRGRLLLDEAIAAAVRQASATWEGEPAEYLRQLLDDQPGTHVSFLRSLHAAGRRQDSSWSDISELTREQLRGLCGDIEASGEKDLRPGEAREAVGVMEELFELRRDSDVRRTKAYPPRIDSVAGQWSRLRRAILRGDLTALRDVVQQLRAPGKIPAKLEDPIRQLRHIHRCAARRKLYRAEGAAAEALAHLMQDIDDRYRQSKDELAVIDYDDQQRLALQVLRNDRKVRHQLRRQYPHLLVDEFQDTDDIQWELVQQLRDLYEEPGGLLLVGDADQSIYRFRGADVEVFREARRRLEQLGACDLTMTKNFRSSPALIDTFNACFSSLLPGFDELKPADESTHSHCSSSATDVMVVHREEDESARQARVQQGRGAAQWIEEYAAGRGRYGDVAILVRALNTVDPVVEALEERRIPHRIIGGRDFYLSQEVADVRMLLMWLDDEAEDVALAGVLRSPFCGLDDATLLRLSECSESTLYESLCVAAEEDEILDGVCRRLRRWRDESHLLPLDDFLLMVLDESGYREAHAVTPEGGQISANLAKIVVHARRAGREEGLNPGEFARELEVLSTMQSDEGNAPVESEEADVVRVMTIHKAKGLEFPVVIVPDADSSMLQFRSQFVLNPEMGLAVATRERKEVQQLSEMKTDSFFDMLREREKEAVLQEEHRIFYVACTRAEQQLVLVGASKKLPEDFRHVDAAAGLDRISPTSNSYLRWLQAGLDGLDESLIRWRPYYPSEDTDELPDRTGGEERSVVSLLTARAHARIYDAVMPAGDLLDRAHSVTALVDYQSCPRLYLLRHRLQWPELRPEEAVGGEAGHRDPLLFGTLVHRVCELLPGVDVDTAVDVALSEQGIDPDDGRWADEMQDMVRRYTESDLYEEIRRADARDQSSSEWAFSCPLPDPGAAPIAHLVGKIDQLYVDADGTQTVVDFKTDHIRPEQVCGRVDLHSFQVQVYAWVVRRLLDVQQVRGYLHFLHPACTEEVQVCGGWSHIEGRIRELVTRIERDECAESFPPAGTDFCHWCGYRFHCDSLQ